MQRILALVCGLIFLSGCASSPKETADASENLHYTKEASLKLRWRTSIGEGSKGAYLRIEPFVDEETIYTADPSGSVYALNLKNGKTLWSTKLNEVISAGVIVTDSCLIVATQNGFLHCLNPDNGNKVWQTRLSSEAISTPAADDQQVFVHTVDGRVTAFDLSAGQQVWSYESAMPVLTVRGTGSPLVLDQLVVIGFATGKVVGLDKPLGVPRWEVRLASPDGRSELERLVDIDGQPIFESGLIYAASYHGNVAAIGLRGETVWEEQGSSYTSPEFSLGSLYLTLDNDHVQAYDAENGAKIWQQTSLTGRKLGQVTAHKRYLAVADNDGNLYLISQINGELVNHRLLRPKPLHVNYPNQTTATKWRNMRGKHMGIRSEIISTDLGMLVYTNSGELMLVDVK